MLVLDSVSSLPSWLLGPRAAYSQSRLCCSWRLIEGALGIANAVPDEGLLGGQNFADWLFSYAASHGLHVVRIFGIGDIQDKQVTS